MYHFTKGETGRLSADFKAYHAGECSLDKDFDSLRPIIEFSEGCSMKKWVEKSFAVFASMFLMLGTGSPVYAQEDTASDTVDASVTEIYLNGVSGDDAMDGTARNLAVRSFEKAKEIATENQNITTIYVIGRVNVAGDVTLAGTNAILKRDPSFRSNLLSVGSNVTVSLHDITVDGNSADAASTSYSLINVDGGTLNIQDGTVLENNVLTDLDYFCATGGAIRAEDGSVINMTGGTIQNNTANFGGGIYLSQSTMNFSGGVIQNNNAIDGTEENGYGYAAGGGICIYNGSTLNMSNDAAIQNNTSQNSGGGISVGTGVASNYSDVLNMTGGIISGNTAGSGGGGIKVQAGFTNSYGVANISGGQIINNKMTGEGSRPKEFGGGGIYVNGYRGYGYHNAVLNLTNAVIKENVTTLDGGGYASCPTSETHIYFKNGVAIYHNYASTANEIYILASNYYGAHSGNPDYDISNAMLGGTPYNWKYEDGSEVPLNDLHGTLDASIGQELELHTDVQSDAAAESLAKVIISGNESKQEAAVLALMALSILAQAKIPKSM